MVRIFSFALALAASAGASPRLEGVYVERDYLEALSRAAGPHNVPFPKHAVTLAFAGDRVNLNWNNHEGLSLSYTYVTDLKAPRSDTGRYVYIVNDSQIRFREGYDRNFHTYTRIAGISDGEYGAEAFNNLYEATFLRGTYLCENTALCKDTVRIESGRLSGLGVSDFKLWFAIDWLDNMPQLDYLVLSNTDTSLWYGYAAFSGGLSLFTLRLPSNCKNFRDDRCALADTRRGPEFLRLKKVR